ncbi:glutathione S-transferase family protein [Parasphingopyxis sp.]|uniref:glutathione S-transferase family protein n=1 Tax=Parasphingopyxis sp. TaxID=1920299 RepID=UPI002617EC1E|nr:glutathione S-transferase family protein [Parasphingopyxis sp.]
MTETSPPERIELMGAPGSPYTRKMIAYLRYRHIRYAMRWGGMMGAPEGYPKPKVRLMPTFFFRDMNGALEAVVDSTPIIRRLEADMPGRAAVPPDPALAFINYLIEDYADEWLTKAMFHYRWHYDADAKNAGPLLIHWAEPTLPDDQARTMAETFSQRQIDRLYVVGSNETTAETIESSYVRLLDILDTLIGAQGYMLGRRPSSADFALYGQLTQLTIVDPTPAALAAERSPRVRAWVDRVDDLSGLVVQTEYWVDIDAVHAQLTPLLTEIGRVYAPFLLANAQAVMNGAEDFETEIDGRPWSQPTFPYQAKCLQWIREEFAALSPDDQARVNALIDGTGCEPLLG